MPIGKALQCEGRGPGLVKERMGGKEKKVKSTTASNLSVQGNRKGSKEVGRGRALWRDKVLSFYSVLWVRAPSKKIEGEGGVQNCLVKKSNLPKSKEGRWRGGNPVLKGRSSGDNRDVTTKPKGKLSEEGRETGLRLGFSRGGKSVGKRRPPYLAKTASFPREVNKWKEVGFPFSLWRKGGEGKTARQ